MAIAYVGGVKGPLSSGGGIFSLASLTGGIASAPAAGDIVIVGFGRSSAPAVDPSIGVTTAGYTELGELFQTGTTSSNLSVSWKLMGSTPDTSVQLTNTDFDDAGYAIIDVFRGVDPTAPFAHALLPTATGIETGRPLPPTITPTALNAVIIVHGVGAASFSTISSQFLDDAEDFSVFDTDTAVLFGRGVTYGRGLKSWGGSGAVSFSRWNGGTYSVNDTWAAMAMALRPKVFANAALTPAAATLSAAATLVGKGAVAVTLAAATLSATAGLQAKATAALTTEAATMASAGKAIVGAAAALTTEAATLAASNLVPRTATAALAPAAATLSGAAAVAVHATAAVTPDAATASAAAITGTRVVTPSDRILSLRE